MKIKNKVLTGLDGEALRVQNNPGIPPSADAPELTVAKVLINAALTPAQNKPYTAPQNVDRYGVALQLNKLPVDDEIEISVDLIAELKGDVIRLYGPLVAGQMVGILNGE